MKSSLLLKILLILSLISCGQLFKPSRNSHLNANDRDATFGITIDTDGNVGTTLDHDYKSRDKDAPDRSDRDTDRYSFTMERHAYEKAEQDIDQAASVRDTALTQEAARELNQPRRDHIPPAERQADKERVSEKFQQLEELRSKAADREERVRQQLDPHLQQIEQVHDELKQRRIELAALHNAAVHAVLAENPAITADGGQDSWSYETPIDSPEGGRIQAATSYRQYAESVVNAQSGPYHAQQQEMLDISTNAIQSADASYAQGDSQAGDMGIELAYMAADIAISFTPLAFPRDVYEAVTGKNLLTGTTLDSLSYKFAVLGVVTLGASGIIEKIPVAMRAVRRILAARGLAKLPLAEEAVEFSERVFDSAKKIGFKTGGEIKDHVGVIERWSANFKTTRIDDAAVINRGFPEPPYLAGSKVVEFETTAAQSFVRVHGPSNQARNWIVRQSDIEGLTGAQIAQKFNIPDVPTMISRADIPSGTTIRTGIVGPNAFGGSKGAIQYEIRMPNDSFVPSEWFTKIGDL